MSWESHVESLFFGVLLWGGRGGGECGKNTVYVCGRWGVRSRRWYGLVCMRLYVCRFGLFRCVGWGNFSACGVVKFEASLWDIIDTLSWLVGLGRVNDFPVNAWLFSQVSVLTSLCSLWISYIFSYKFFYYFYLKIKLWLDVT